MSKTDTKGAAAAAVPENGFRTRWDDAKALPLGRASMLHFQPVEGTVLDLDSLDALVWSDHDALWTWLRGLGGGSRGIVLEGLNLRRRDKQHVVSPGRCIIPVQGSGRLVMAELRESFNVRMDYGVLVLRAIPREVRQRGARAASEVIELAPLVLQLDELEPTDLPLEFNRQEQGRVDAYRDLRRLDPPHSSRVDRHVKAYRELIGLIWAGGTEGEAASGQAVINIPMSSRVRATAVMEAAAAQLRAAPSTSSARYRLHDTIKEVLSTMDDFSEDRNASRRLLNELAELGCDQTQARTLAGVEGDVD
jgi:hypothetical protein